VKSPTLLDALQKIEALFGDLITVSRNLQSCNDVDFLRGVVAGKQGLYTQLIPPGTPELQRKILESWNSGIQGLKQLAELRLKQLADTN
jgi:hypothetical protein